MCTEMFISTRRLRLPRRATYVDYNRPISRSPSVSLSLVHSEERHSSTLVQYLEQWLNPIIHHPPPAQSRRTARRTARVN